MGKRGPWTQNLRKAGRKKQTSPQDDENFGKKKKKEYRGGRPVENPCV